MPQGANDGYPEGLGDFLKEVVRRERRLRMYVLSWDFVMVLRTTANGCRFTSSAGTPILVLASPSGSTISIRSPARTIRKSSSSTIRSRSSAVSILRTAAGIRRSIAATSRTGSMPKAGQARPYHDVQAIVDGAAARALGELCRDRWRRATHGRTLPVDEAPASDPWPRGLAPEITGVDVAIARTDPGYVTRQPVEEIRRLYADVISSAQRSLYIENQFCSSSVVGAADR